MPPFTTTKKFYYPTSTPVTITLPSNGSTPVTIKQSSNQLPIDFGFSPFNGIDWAIPIKQSKVKIGNEEGYICNGCKEFYPMAELNQPSGASEFTSFTCYCCRNGLSL